MTDRLEQASKLTTTLALMLTDVGEPGVHVTVNPLEVASAARGAGCILIQPPDLTFETWDVTESRFEIVVIAGPADNTLEAWRRIDTIIQALEAGHLNMSTASPASFKPPQGDTLPAYEIKLNNLED